MCFVPDFEKAVKQSIRAKFEGITSQGNKRNSRFWRSPAAAGGKLASLQLCLSSAKTLVLTSLVVTPNWTL